MIARFGHEPSPFCRRRFIKDKDCFPIILQNELIKPFQSQSRLAFAFELNAPADFGQGQSRNADFLAMA